MFDEEGGGDSVEPNDKLYSLKFLNTSFVSRSTYSKLCLLPLVEIKRHRLSSRPHVDTPMLT
jgi:hypothetical protein